MKRGASALVLVAIVSLLTAVPSAAQPSGTMTWGIHVTLATRWLTLPAEHQPVGTR